MDSLIIICGGILISLFTSCGVIILVKYMVQLYKGDI